MSRDRHKHNHIWLWQCLTNYSSTVIRHGHNKFSNNTLIYKHGKNIVDLCFARTWRTVFHCGAKHLVCSISIFSGIIVKFQMISDIHSRCLIFKMGKYKTKYDETLKPSLLSKHYLKDFDIKRNFLSKPLVIEFKNLLVNGNCCQKRSLF